MKQAKKPAVASQEASTQASEIEDEELPFNAIEVLQEHGINMQDITKLKAAGIATVKAVLMT